MTDEPVADRSEEGVAVDSNAQRDGADRKIDGPATPDEPVNDTESRYGESESPA